MRASFTALAAIFTLALGASMAQAITVEPAGAITSRSLGSVLINYSVGSITCQLSLAGTLSARVENAAGASFGAYTAGAFSGCSREAGWTPLFAGGGWRKALAASAELSEAQSGLIRFTVSNVQIAWEIFPGARCLYGGTISMQMRVRGTPLRSGLLEITGTALGLTAGSSVLCSRAMPLAGTFSLEPAQTLVL